MKKIEFIEELPDLILAKEDLYQYLGDKPVVLPYQRFINMSIVQILEVIRVGNLFKKT